MDLLEVPFSCPDGVTPDETEVSWSMDADCCAVASRRSSSAAPTPPPPPSLALFFRGRARALFLLSVVSAIDPAVAAAKVVAAASAVQLGTVPGEGALGSAAEESGAGNDGEGIESAG